jgi:hypothetical protein
MSDTASGEATRQERIAQGFPPHVTDPAVLDRVAALLLTTKKRTSVTEPRSSNQPTDRPSPKEAINEKTT